MRVRIEDRTLEELAIERVGMWEIRDKLQAGKLYKGVTHPLQEHWTEWRRRG